MAIALPTVHLNGTSIEELARMNQEAMTAVWVALDAVHDARPNPRDYYPQGDEAWTQAEREHLARQKLLVSIKDDFETIRGALLDQDHKGVL